jgi:Mu-like prophage major head subunit gpT
MMVRGQFAQLMAPGLYDEFLHWIDLLQRDEEYSHLFHIETSKMAYEDEVEFAGLPPMIEKPEGESIAYSDAIQGGTKRYLHLTFGLGIRASFELFEDDQYGVIKQVPKALARSSQFVREQNAANIFNLGFTTVTTTDGLSLFNTSHPLLGGASATAIAPGVSSYITGPGTFPNRPLVDVDLGFTAIQVMVNQFERLPDSQGMPISIKPRLLVIPPELKWIAREILGSSHKPYTADNEINAILGEDLQYFVSHYLTSTSAWFCLSDKMSHRLKFFVRHELEEDFADDFDTRTIKQVAFMRFSVGATVWEGTWGSNGP